MGRNTWTEALLLENCKLCYLALTVAAHMASYQHFISKVSVSGPGAPALSVSEASALCRAQRSLCLSVSGPGALCAVSGFGALSVSVPTLSVPPIRPQLQAADSSSESSEPRASATVCHSSCLRAPQLRAACHPARLRAATHPARRVPFFLSTGDPQTLLFGKMYYIILNYSILYFSILHCII